MKTLKYSIPFICCAINTANAGFFTDLNFEVVYSQIHFLDPPANIGATATSAFPGWTTLLNGVPQNGCSYNTITTGAAEVALFSTLGPRAGQYGPVLAGNYTAGLEASVIGESAALEQTGTIPAGSKSLVFIGSIGAGTSVSLNGSLAPLVHLGHMVTGSPGGYDTYGVDVSALAGQTVQLEFSTTTIALLDNLTFSPVALAPEPSTYALTILGGTMLWFVSRRKSS